MDQPSLESILADLNLPAIRFYSCIDSTNDEAIRWLDSGAPHLALILADEQTAGRGRSRHRWVTSPGTALAFSLVLLSPPLDPHLLSRLTGLGAVAIQNALGKKYNLSAQIKWPNDVLLDGCKVAGVLVEARWNGDALFSAIIGIGINIAPQSVSAVNLPATGLNFPATCVENALGNPVDRLELLHAILQELLTWLPRLSLPDFIHEWESNLAYRHQWVELSTDITAGDTSTPSSEKATPVQFEQGKLIGLTQDGSLKLLTASGKMVVAAVGDIHLRPAADHPILPTD